jgi:eukaryotic-like serine/threonine-protein kinase
MSDPAALLGAALADHYRIERELGTGGMATVYLAEDLKHHRKVAVKVLKPELAAVLGAERFVQEITTTAALQHPHILPLFDSGEASGFLYYVMPFIDGETLRTRLDREHQLAVSEAVRIAREVADALDYAHRHGVIHRDIKPENILLHDGRPMVADFGIALALSAAAGGRMTETGLSLGTPHYMSPEQATAEKEITGRSDIYSLGSVLYEMLTGDPPHVGSSAQQIIMKIITEPAAPVTKARKSVPHNVAAAVAESLEKLPADRFESAKAFADALADPLFTGTGETRGTTAINRAHARRSRRPLAAALLLCVLLLAVAIAGWLRPAPALGVSRQRVVLWHHSLEAPLAVGGEHVGSQAAIAPDGSSIVYVDSSGGTTRLMRKRRSESAATEMAGTEGAVSPFFAPDGKWIGYRTVDGKIRRLPIDGGGSITITEDGDLTYTTAAWLDDGSIVYAARQGGLARIASTGGVGRPIRADSLRNTRTYLHVAPLPGSKGFLFTDCPGNCAIESAFRVFDFKADSSRLLVANAVGVGYSPTGHLLYTDRSGGLYAMGFDPERLETTTAAVGVIDDVVPASFSMSASGTALYAVQSGFGAPAELMWVARDGTAQPLDSTWHGDFQYPALSPDGRSLAVSVTEATTQIWIRHADGTRQKLTNEGAVNWRPAWTPDGQSLGFSTNRRGTGSQDDFDFYLSPMDGSAPARLLAHHRYGIWEAEFSPDGHWLVIRSDEPNGASNFRGRRLDGDSALVPVLLDETLKTQIAFSPDGRWIAYNSEATGRRELYVVAFPTGAPPRLVSRGGGVEPRWAHSGKELFYRSGNQLISVAVTPGSTLLLGPPRALFSVAPYRSARNRQQYDVAPDDRHFVMIRELPQQANGGMVYVENWLPELLAKVKR